jgi:hypothetical protein
MTHYPEVIPVLCPSVDVRWAFIPLSSQCNRAHPARPLKPFAEMCSGQSGIKCLSGRTGAPARPSIYTKPVFRPQPVLRPVQPLVRIGVSLMWIPAY